MFRNLAWFVVSSLICAVAFVYLKVEAPLFSGPGFSDGQEKAGFTLITIVLAITAMLLGIVCGVIFDSFSDDSGRITKNELIAAIASKKMVRAATVSPLVFFSVLSGIKGIEDLAMVCMFAFQNGFFWQKTLGSVRTSTST